MPRTSRPQLRAAAGFAVALVVLGVAATWPLFSDPAILSPAGIGNNDFWLNVWIVHWGAHALTTEPLTLHHANIFWPERYTLAYADIEVSHSLLALPLIAAGAGPVLVVNLLVLASIVIGGTGGFLLGHRVTGSLSGAAATGLVFVFNDAHFARRLAIQFFGDHWLPWLALATLAWLDRRTWRPALAAGALFVLHAGTGSHNAVFGALVVGVLVAVHAVRARLWRDRRFVASTAAFALLPLLLLVPLFYPYLLVQERLETERRADPQLLRGTSARPIDLASGASRLHAWIDERSGWPSRVLPGPLGAHLFPGWAPLLLAGAAVVLGRPRAESATAAGVERGRAPPGPDPADVVVWWILGGLCLWLALGPAAGLYRAVAALPGLGLIRVPSRFVLPGLLALAVLAGVGAAAIVRRSGRGPWVVGALLLLFAVESAHAPVEATDFDFSPDTVTEWIGSREGTFTVLEVPVEPDNLSAHARQALFSIHHFQRLLVGYSGWRSPEVTRRLRSIDRRFPGRAILDELVGLDVRYVVAREARLPARVLREMRQERRLREVFRDGTVSVWELSPAPGEE